MKKIQDGSYLTSYTVGEFTYHKPECLLIYNQYCDKYELTPDKEIENGSTKVIFEECCRIYNEYGVS